MAIKKTTLLALAALLKMDAAKVEAAINDAAEVDLELPADLTVLTPADLAARDQQQKSTHTKAGMEIAIKEMKEKTGLEFNGKTPEQFIEAFQAKVLKDANISVDTQVKDKDKIIDGLRKNLGEKEQSLVAVQNEAKAAKADAQLLSLLPPNRSKILSDQEYLSLAKNSFEIGEADGRPAIIDRTTGEPIRTKDTLLPVPPADVIKGHFEAKKWIEPAQQQQQGGRSAGDSKTIPGSITNMTQLKEKMKAEGINPNGQQAKAMIQEVTKANPNFSFKEEVVGV